MALEELCQLYIQPVFAFIRRRVANHEQSEDATQEFFSLLIDGTLLQRADQNRGRFRSFLLHAVSGFLADLYDHDHAVKRGGKIQHVALELHLTAHANGNLSPEAEFDLHWVRSLLQSALEQLQQEYSKSDRSELFATLKSALDDGEKVNAAEASVKLRMTEAAIRVALHRMRKRLGQLIREQILATVQTAADVDDEIKKLMQILELNR